ncbi:LysE family translocator [Celerinatantimonas diazotrophica]|uniref:Threonine/homoserine/homoserine lactone efflux protein n=1 Tax=Celerinatantimonas diazotrophica TaxID=412034 RepID=A0A4R1K1U7_9GAMM|nr:LysE family translocator [Celerinatantimonas diazotrophica]TCK57880.1 threonine/homoserine/homoserine lactone efflux protein [Celerinatantimonas diazotrophica]CAG9298052.1 hypothetical protein CEDIAZO_03247 [Celerinatantimonas diazotrophica]
MELQVFLPFILFSFFASVTPGPANLAIFSQSCNSKWKQIFLFCLGVSIGFLFVLFSCGIIYLSGISHVQINYLLKLFGSCYFIYLGITIYSTDVSHIDNCNQLKSFIKGLFVHPFSYKAWLFVILAYSSFIPPALHTKIIYFGGIFLLSSIISMIPWIITGYVIGKKINPEKLTIINRISGIALISLVIFIWII